MTLIILKWLQHYQQNILLHLDLTEQEVFDALDEFELSVQKGEVKARYDGFEDFIKSVLLYVGVGLGISLITFIFKVRQDEL